jgi:hypothetical protein
MKHTNFSNNIGVHIQNYSFLLWHESDPWHFELQFFLFARHAHLLFLHPPLQWQRL